MCYNKFIDLLPFAYVPWQVYSVAYTEKAIINRSYFATSLRVSDSATNEAMNGISRDDLQYRQTQTVKFMQNHVNCTTSMLKLNVIYPSAIILFETRRSVAPLREFVTTPCATKSSKTALQWAHGFQFNGGSQSLSAFVSESSSLWCKCD